MMGALGRMAGQHIGRTLMARLNLKAVEERVAPLGWHDPREVTRKL